MSQTPTSKAASAEARLLGRIRLLLGVFVIGLIVSGLTAIPLEQEIDILSRLSGLGIGTPGTGGLDGWISLVREGLRHSYGTYPFLAYGTDWLAFGHVVIALAFLGPYRDPVRNVWVVEFGIIACALVVPFALLMGPFRGIPLGWRLIDCSFGVFGVIPLLLCRRYIRQLQTGTNPDMGASGSGK